MTTGNKKTNYNIEAVRRAIEYCGDSKRMSELLGMHKVTINKWACGMEVPSMQSCVKIERVTNKEVMRWEIRQDIEW
jgi:DNA-binding transcriptional regulator YdaS (Cro superfamily)